MWWRWCVLGGFFWGIGPETRRGVWGSFRMQGAAQSFQTPETLPRFQKARETSSPHVSPKEIFKRSLRQLDVSEEYPEVICATKLLFAPPSQQERIAALAWMIKTKSPKEAGQSLIQLCSEIRTQGSHCHASIVRHGLVIIPRLIKIVSIISVFFSPF